jgi:hypothetical protein
MIMKLSSAFLSHDDGEQKLLVSTGASKFSGLVRSNKTAAYIVDLLKEETTEEKIIDALCARYDASREVITTDVRKILDTLRSINALEE